MNPSAGIALTLAGAAAAALVGAGIFARLRRRKKSPAEIERLRRLDVNRRGRIISGRIVDFLELAEDSDAQLVVYKYVLAGVTYEAAQDVSALPVALALARHAADRAASVKYDPRVPTNSIIACEDWCGVPDRKQGSGIRNPGVGTQNSELEETKKQG